MYVDEKKQGEIQQAPAKVLKLSEAIREGCKNTTERRKGFWDGGDGACAICAAHFAFFGREYPNIQKIADRLGIPKQIVMSASARHANGTESREQIADWLESKGY